MNYHSLKKSVYEAEFKEFELWLEIETRLKYGLFHLKLYSMFQDLSRCSFETGFLADLKRGSNSLNSDSEYIYLFCEHSYNFRKVH